MVLTALLRVNVHSSLSVTQFFQSRQLAGKERIAFAFLIPSNYLIVGPLQKAALI